MGILALIVLAVAIVAMVVVFFVSSGRESNVEPKPSVEPEKPTEKPVEKPKEPLQESQKPKVDNDKPKEEKEPEKPKEEPQAFIPPIFLDPFKEIIEVKQGTKTYDYLYELYNEACHQYGGSTCQGLPLLYKEECFPHIYNYYGDDGKEDIAPLVGWLFAMQLAELRPQDRTAIYKIGYEMGGCNKDSKLYGWKFKCDPNICRMVASAIYAAMRGVCKPDIEAMRKECGGISISDTIEDVKESDSFNLDRSYYIDLREFMPTAAGPYAPNYKDRSKIGDYPYPNDAKTDDYNLAIDRAIRDMAVEKYNLEGVQSSCTLNSLITDVTYIKRTVQAIADKDANYNHLFGKPRLVDDYYFYPVFTSETLGQEVYPSLAKPLCELVDDVLHIGSYQRCILQGHEGQENPPQYGRLRPGCSWQVEAHRHSDDDDTQNVLVDFYIEENDGNPTGYYDADGEWVNKSGIHSPEEYNDVMKDQLWANSYPSGHSAGIMSCCLLLIELLPKQADKILAAANNFAVNRTIARYHWNSDTIQGRVLATCVAPIIRCCSDWKERFKKALECLKSV